MFQLSDEETLNKNSNLRGQHFKYLPYVFTEQGVAMLCANLRTEVAEEISVAIMDVFVSMRKYKLKTFCFFKKKNSH